MSTLTIKNKMPPLLLKLPVMEVFSPLAGAFITHGSKGLGLTSEAAEEIGLAAEEVTAYLSQVCTPGQEMEIRCVSASHFVEASFSLPVRDMALGTFNMTASICAEDSECLNQMGLLIASRMTDRFKLSRQSNGHLLLTLVKERIYPEINLTQARETPKALSTFKLTTPDREQIKWFLRRIGLLYPETLAPKDFRYPGKLLDMISAGEYRIQTALGPDGEVGGGIAWRWEGQKTVEFFGPYIFHPKSAPAMAQTLLEACIGEVARTSALVLMTRMPTPELPDGYLEPLGTLGGLGSTDPSESDIIYFRMIHEDDGAVVWSHPDLVDFLQNEFKRLVFPREIQPVFQDEEYREPQSVLSVEMDHSLRQATLRPIWPGSNAAANLADHLRVLKNEAIERIFFEMDLGLSWQATFTTGLLQQGFSPRLILPHAGMGDLVIFALEADPA
jgi:hypothetical protein